MALCRPFVRPPEKGAETGLFLATDPSIQGQNGGYYKDLICKTPLAQAADDDMARALWEKSLVMTEPPY